MIKLFAKILLYINKFIRYFLLIRYKKYNISENFSLICNNCIGGVIYHELGMKFLSPTINLSIGAEDYIKFLKNLNYYLKITPTNFYFDEKLKYPIGYIEDIKIYFVHYRSFEECINKWEERKKRIDFNNIFLISSDIRGMNKNLLLQFLDLPYKKICYVSKKDLLLSDDCIYIPGYEKEEEVPNLLDYVKLTGYRYIDYYFNVYKWIAKDNK